MVTATAATDAHRPTDPTIVALTDAPADPLSTADTPTDDSTDAENDDATAGGLDTTGSSSSLWFGLVGLTTINVLAVLALIVYRKKGVMKTNILTKFLLLKTSKILSSDVDQKRVSFFTDLKRMGLECIFH